MTIVITPIFVLFKDRLKQCTKCGELKSYNDFHKNKCNKDGLQYCCKSCKSKEAKTYNENKVEKFYKPKITGMKICVKCKMKKDVNDFYIDKRKGDGRKTRCK